MDKKRSILNIGVSILSRIILLCAALYVRRLLIQYIGNAVNGLNSLYTSIIGMLSVAELGVGSAIVYSMYHPIVNGDKHKVAALFCLYKKVYLVIGVVIAIGGLIVTPCLPSLIKEYDKLNINVYVTYLLTLSSVVISYLYSAKTSLIEAYKDNYITTGILGISRLIRYVLQGVSILLWKSYTLFLICQIIETLLAWGLTEMMAYRKHADIIEMHESVDQDTKAEVWRNVKAMFMHKIGTILVNSVDSMIISAYIGVVALGKYSNYMLIASVAAGTIGLFFTSLSSIVGHLCAVGKPEQTRKYFDRFYCLNYILGFVFFLGYFATADSLVSLCFGPSLDLSRAIVFIIAMNQFTSFMRRTSLLFRDASGTFYYDRWKPVVEGVVNLFLSILFVNVFPEGYRMAGVIAATIATSLLICHTVEPYVVFHHVFYAKPKSFYLRNYGYIALFAICLSCMTWIIKSYNTIIASVIINGLFSLLVSVLAMSFLFVVDKGFRNEVRALIRAIPTWMTKLSDHE